MNHSVRALLLKRQPARTATVTAAGERDPAELVLRALEYAEEGTGAKETRRVYLTQWSGFEDWCRLRGCSSLPAEPAALALYLTDRADQGAGRSTIDQIIAAVNQRHDLAGFAPPSRGREAKLVIRGIRRRVGRPKRRATPVTPAELRQMVR